MKSGPFKRAMLLLVPLCVVILIAGPISAAAAPINVFLVDNYDKQIDAGEGATFTWVVFNNDSGPVIVRTFVTPSESHDVDEAFDVEYVTLGPGESAPLNLKVTTLRTMGSANITFNVTLSTARMDDPTNLTTVNEVAYLKVTAVYGAGVGSNKIFGIWPNTLPAPFDTNWGAFLVTVIGWILIALFFAFVVDPLVHYLTRKTETELDDIILRIIRAPLFVFILSYGTVTSLEILNIDRDLVAQIEQLYNIIIVLLVVWVAYKIYKEIVIFYAKEYSKKTDTEIDDVVVPLMEKIGLIVIPLVGLMWILGMLGFDLTGLLAGAGFLGIVIGLAAQSTLANFFAGIQLLADRPFKIGDMLRLEDGDSVEVKHIGMRATTLYNPDTDELVVIPNNEIANKRIINMVEPDRKLRIVVVIGVGYGSDVDKVMDLLRTTAMEHPNVLKDPAHHPVVRFSDFGDSALNFKTFIWVDDIANRYKVASDFRQAINERFKAEGIEIPFPQSVVTVRYEKKAEEKK